MMESVQYMHNNLKDRVMNIAHSKKIRFLKQFQDKKSTKPNENDENHNPR
jgi:hypothetical protein